MAGCLCVDLLYCGYCTIPEFILAVKDCDLGNAVQSSLDLDSSGSTACTDDSHFLSNHINIIIFQGRHKSNTVSDMTCKMTVVIYDRVNCTA